MSQPRYRKEMTPIEEAHLSKTAEAAASSLTGYQLTEIENLRAQLHELVDRKVDLLTQQITSGQAAVGPLVLPLDVPSAIFKGKKPIALVFPDGAEVAVPTWKKAAAAIMRDCNDDPRMHESLLYLCGKVSGKLRVILDRTPERMDVPLKIDEGLYLESKYDTESLLTVLTKRVLDVVGYDYHGIMVKYRDPRLEMTASPGPDQPEEKPADQGMRMQM